MYSIRVKYNIIKELIRNFISNLLHRKEVLFMLKKIITFLNGTVEKPLITDNELSIWNELEDDVSEDELEEKYRLL